MVGCTRSLLSPPLLSAISICWTFLHCTLSNVSNVSNWLLEIIHSHIDMHYLKHCAPSFSLLFCLRPVFGKMDQMLSAWVIFSSYSPLEVLLLFSRFIVELWIFLQNVKMILSLFSMIIFFDVPVDFLVALRKSLNICIFAKNSADTRQWHATCNLNQRLWERNMFECLHIWAKTSSAWKTTPHASWTPVFPPKSVIAYFANFVYFACMYFT